MAQQGMSAAGQMGKAGRYAQEAVDWAGNFLKPMARVINPAYNAYSAYQNSDSLGGMIKDAGMSMNLPGAYYSQYQHNKGAKAQAAAELAAVKQAGLDEAAAVAETEAQAEAKAQADHAAMTEAIGGAYNADGGAEAEAEAEAVVGGGVSGGGLLPRHIVMIQRHAGLPETGQMDDATAAAKAEVEAFQTAQGGLVVDGIPGRRTLAAMGGSTPITPAAPVVSNPISEPVPAPVSQVTRATDARGRIDAARGRINSVRNAKKAERIRLRGIKQRERIAGRQANRAERLTNRAGRIENRAGRVEGRNPDYAPAPAAVAEAPINSLKNEPLASPTFSRGGLLYNRRH